MIRMKGAWSTWKLLPKLFPYLRHHRKLVAGAVLLTGLGAAIGLAQPWPLALMVDSVLGKHSPPAFVTHLIGHNRNALLVFAALAGLAVAIIGNGLTVLHEYVNTKLEQRLSLDFRSDLFQHAQRLSMTYHDESPTGMLMNQITFEADAAGQLLMAILPLAQSAITLLGMFYVAYRIDPLLALLSLTVVPFIYYSVVLYNTQIVPRLQYVRGLEWQSLSIIYESLNMVRVVAAFAREPHEYRRFRKQGETAVDARVRLTVRQTMFSLGVNTCTATGSALVLGVGAYHVLHHRLTIGEMLVLIFYISAVYNPLETISSTIGSLQQQLIMIQGAFMVLDTEPDITDAPDAVAVEHPQGAFAFENVSFSYREREGTLRHISFEVAAGWHVALVGPTGAGKTTLVSLIKRFYDPDEGRVLLDGTDLRKLKVRSLREQVSVVLQTPLLFSGSIAENIRYGRLDATIDEIVEAAKDANVHDFIEALPDGYDTELSEGGAQLSVGERQRICVARAFLKNAPILILDEPTSSIDSMTEAVILDALDRLMVGRTTFVIAHRLSTIRHADQILVMDGGGIVERGTHDELVALDGLYRRLHNAQVNTRQADSPLAAIGRRATALPTSNGAARVGDAELKAELERMLARSSNHSLQPESVQTAAALLVRATCELRENAAWEPLRSLARLRTSPLAELRIAAEVAHALLHDLGLAGEPLGEATLDADCRAEIVRRLTPALRLALSEVAR